MTLHHALDEMNSTLRRTRARLLAPLDLGQQVVPDDPEIFVEDVLLYVMDEWGADLREQGHVLEQDEEWKDEENHFPLFRLHLSGGRTLFLHFTGHYPEHLHLTVSKAMRRMHQFSDAEMFTFRLPVTMDPNVLLFGLIDGMKQMVIA
ncbi:MAG: hypothetical protein H6595_11130 [Flavobacteriales bacterium]|nr:hypothetical protein [Flavobacteriales bacterium]MCB9168013.1 hypothetical protein [Flavobacteriales bacterium]